MANLFSINVSSEIRRFQKTIDKTMRDQIPFAVSAAINETAKKVKISELKGFASSLHKPTPFTMNSMGIVFAKKKKWEATIFVKDIQAAYLAPSEDGGKQVLLPVLAPTNSFVLTPKAKRILNQYDNLPRNKISQLKKQNGIFVGTIKFKNGDSIEGVWQRPSRSGAVNKNKGNAPILLVRFTKPKDIQKRLKYQQIAKVQVDLWLPFNLERAMKNAMATKI